MLTKHIEASPILRFDLPAAEAVCADAELEADEVMDLVASLVEKSLVAMEQRDGESRFRMLETIREYAGEKLAESQGMQAAAAARHCHYFFDLSKRAATACKGRNSASGWTAWAWSTTTCARPCGCRRPTTAASTPSWR